MKRGLFWLAIAFGIFGTVALLARPFDWNFTMQRGHRTLGANMSVLPGEARAQTAEEGVESLRSQSKAFVRSPRRCSPRS